MDSLQGPSSFLRYLNSKHQWNRSRNTKSILHMVHLWESLSVKRYPTLSFSTVCWNSFWKPFCSAIRPPTIWHQTLGNVVCKYCSSTGTYHILTGTHTGAQCESCRAKSLSTQRKGALVLSSLAKREGNLSSLKSSMATSARILPSIH